MLTHVRPASAADLAAIHAVLAPELRSGTVLPRRVDPEDFLVAEQHGHGLVGTVALSDWGNGVAELGALVASQRGHGVGSQLVSACTREARRRGFHTLVALTSSPGFFGRLGFQQRPVAPWALARQEACGGDEELGPALQSKAKTCAGCPRLAGCQQSLLSLPLRVARRRAA